MRASTIGLWVMAATAACAQAEPHTIEVDAAGNTKKADGAINSVDICLPATHTVIVRTQIHGDERHEDNVKKMFHDNKLKWTLIQHFKHHHRAAPSHVEEAELMDHNRMLHWHWHVYNGTVQGCELSKIEHDHESYCVARDANKTGSGFIGEDFPVDNYYARIDRHGYWAEIDALVESKSTSRIISAHERGRGHTHYHNEKREFYNLTETDIPVKTFEVPEDCPNL